MPLFVVTTNRPGPGARALIGEVPTLPTSSILHGRAISLAAAQDAADGAAEFVELETAEGASVGSSSGIDWSQHPTTDVPLWRLGPFHPANEDGGVTLDIDDVAVTLRIERHPEMGPIVHLDTDGQLEGLAPGSYVVSAA